MKNPAFPLYAQDFDMDTASWDNEEIGMYFRLLMYQWVNGSIPEDEKRLSRIVRCSVKKWRVKSKILLPKFVKKGDGYLQNERMENIRHERDKFLESQSIKGTKSAEKRNEKGNRGSTGVEPEQEPEQEPTVNLSSSFSSSLKDLSISSKKTEDIDVPISPSPEAEKVAEPPEPPPPPEKPKEVQIPSCPHKKIIELYHQICPMLPKVQEWTSKRITLLSGRWNHDPERQNLEWWERFFKDVAASDFLTGQVNEFRADLEWIIRPNNFAKILEGKYANKQGTKTGKGWFDD